MNPRAASRLGVLLALMALGGPALPAPAAGQDTTGAGSTGAQQLSELSGRYWRIQRIRTQLPRVEDWERDGLANQVDRLGLAWLGSLQETILATTDPGAGSLPDTLRTLVREGMRFAAERDQVLQERIGEERGTFEKFEQSARADIARAFIEDLVRTRLAYMASVADLMDVLESVGAGSAGQEAVLRERAILLLERVTGQVELDAQSLDDLRARLRDDPLNEDLENAVALVQAKQARNLDNLESLLAVAQQLDVPTVEQRGLLIRERGAIDAEILQREVFRTLWTDQVARLRAGIARNGPDIVFRAALFLLILAAGWLVSRPIRLLAGYLVSRDRFEFSALVRDLVVSVSGMVILVASLILALSTVGVSLGPLLAGLGVLGLVVGLAIQDSLANLAAGVMILAFRPFDLHDYVEVSGATGTVRRVNLLATTIATLDNRAVTVPNGRIWGTNIVNHTANRARRVDIPVSFSFSEDPDRVRDVLMDVLENYEHVLKTPEPLVHMESLGDSAVIMMAKPWVRTENYWVSLWDLTRLFKKRLDEEGIEIPFPQRVVTLRREGNQGGRPGNTSSAVVNEPGD